MHFVNNTLCIQTHNSTLDGVAIPIVNEFKGKTVADHLNHLSTCSSNESYIIGKVSASGNRFHKKIYEKWEKKFQVFFNTVIAVCDPERSVMLQYRKNKRIKGVKNTTTSKKYKRK